MYLIKGDNGIQLYNGSLEELSGNIPVLKKDGEICLFLTKGDFLKRFEYKYGIEDAPVMGPGKHNGYYFQLP
jgi:hypothetical protein